MGGNQGSQGGAMGAITPLPPYPEHNFWLRHCRLPSKMTLFCCNTPGGRMHGFAHSTVYSMWYTIFVPAIPCLLKIAAIAFGFKIAVSLSLQSRVAHSEMLTLHVSITNYRARLLSRQSNSSSTISGNHFHSQALNLLATLWTISFITALTEMILAGTFGAWYWTYDKEFVTSSALTTAVGRTVTYHLGTVAHGSLVITVCRMIRLTLRRVAQDRNSVAAACAYACFSCFERFLQRFNRNAYIMCAVHGRGLCTSALAAYQLIFRNVSRYVVTELVTDLAFGMCKVLIAVCAGCAVSASIDRPFWDKLDAIQIVVVGSYFIADTCFSVYEMAVATLVLCCRKWLLLLGVLARRFRFVQKPAYLQRKWPFSDLHLQQQQQLFCLTFQLRTRNGMTDLPSVPTSCRSVWK